MSMPHELKVYIAGPLTSRPVAQSLHRYLIDHGYTVVSTWVFSSCSEPAREEKTIHNQSWIDYCLENGDLDKKDIDSADVVVFIGTESTSGGLFVELGYSIASGKKIMWFSEQVPNVFCGQVSKNACSYSKQAVLEALNAHRASL
jgi:nucleoside 2-deoxyribosyltransferase